jgi:putative sigma-54 modulation protein
MLVIVKGKNVEVTPALKAYAEKKLQRLERHFTHLQKMEVTQGVQRSWHTVEVQVEGDGFILRAEERSTDMYQAIDLAAKKLEEQVRRFKGRLIEKPRAARPSAAQQAQDQEEEAAAAAGEAVEGEEPQPKIVRYKRFPIKPMPAEEAAQQMEMLNHSFFVFLNAETQQVNVIYKRHDGDYGLIEPAE